MLTLLVWTIALGSLSIFLAGVIFPELSRKNDLIWVGVGLLYALILSANKANMGAGLIVGQMAGVSLTVWLGWQTMTQRRELTAPDKKTPVPEWLQKIIDVITPLWAKAYGAIASQLGLEQSSDEEESTPLAETVKAKFTELLGKINSSSSADQTSTIEPQAAEEQEPDEVETAIAEASPEEAETPPSPTPLVELQQTSDAAIEANVSEEPQSPDSVPSAEASTDSPAASEPDTSQDSASNTVSEEANPASAADQTVEEGESDSEPPDSVETPPVENKAAEPQAAQDDGTETSDSPPDGDTDAEPQAAQDAPQAAMQEESNWPPEPMN